MEKLRIGGRRFIGRKNGVSELQVKNTSNKKELATIFAIAEDVFGYPVLVQMLNNLPEKMTKRIREMVTNKNPNVIIDYVEKLDFSKVAPQTTMREPEQKK